jgi:tRNA(fMet)-specific endonuclease VapC
MLRYMLDTDTISYALRGVGGVSSRLLRHKPSELCISAISIAELRFGADKRKSRKLHGLIDTFTAALEVTPFDQHAAARFGALVADLVRRGTPIGDFDALIAAHALALDLALVTNNTKHFEQVDGLRIENWI